MRILSVRIRNLNSLSGDWTVRLDGPEYESGGIFAITGPTGAGKSTILDAICLALYGSTPRLDKVTKSSNEIMSRQATECLAEVRFRTMRGEYVCSWSQKRTGKRAAGEFQPPKHRLYDSEGRSIAENTKAVLAGVEELTGMDFARFTQSMLLAQGHFASFLLADGDKRAPLLEKITGKGIYTEISKKVHERSRDERLRLDNLDRDLAARDLLSLEEEEGLTGEKRTLLEGVQALARREEALAGDMARVEQAEALERDEKTLAADKDALNAETAAFAPEKERLERAVRAAALSPSLEALDVRREEERRDTERKAALDTELPRLEAAETAERQALAGARAALAEEKASVERERDTWKKVRAVDTELAARRGDLAALDKELSGRRAELERRKKEQAEAGQAHAKAEQTLADLTKTREARAADAALADATGSLAMRLSLLRQDEAALDATRRALDACSRNLDEQETVLAGRRRSAEALSRALAGAREKLDAARKNFAALLCGRDAAFHRAQREALSVRRNALDKALAAAESRAALLVRAASLKSRGQKLTLAVQKEEGDLALLREKLSALREKLALEAKIRSYEEERKSLREGSPCPLCGATHHPFACEAPALPDDPQKPVRELEARVEALAAALAGHRSDAAHAREACAEAESAAAEQTNALRHALSALSPALSRALTCPSPAESDGAALPEAGESSDGSAPTQLSGRDSAVSAPSADSAPSAVSAAVEPWENEILSALALSEDAPALAPVLERLAAETAAALDEATALLDRLDAQQTAGRALAEDAEKLRRLHDEAQAAVQETEKEALRLGTEKAGLERDLAEKTRKTDAGRDELCRSVSAFGETGSRTEELELAVRALETRRSEYAALVKQEADAREALAGRERLLAVGAQALDAAEREWNAALAGRTERAAALAALENERRALFGDLSVDEEEKAAAKRLRHREEAEEERRSALEAASRALAEARRDAAALAERMTQRSSAMKDMEEALLIRLKSEGFADEAACRAALMNREELDALTLAQQTLAEKAAGLDARAAELARRRAAQILPLPSREETERALAQTRAEREDALQRLGSLQERLDANNEKKAQAAKLREKREAQAARCRRWAALNELIGSADGKKFRNYAQELTFRRLILMANRQLAFMTDRYLLVHSKTEALTLNVIDRYQADAVRSSRNLSGGESFIVSLALALGLAQMASRNVRVDSVFLDEGFGTLDEESLGTALDMLASLRRKGKMIGIISHVQAVRDRVGLQIRVSPKGNGKSAISGPGVSHG
ncbi:AAA family ATPase [uncultured Mailhella sp.]|uniref:AAA family ATPase n=1 Tax=uncultured Mailhella sp. TaxID=1981031 RepID=UPI0025F27EC4|nr:AAA family ATPase [uncultured Mailhella sp.]